MANSIEKDVQREFLVLGIVLFVAIYSFALFLRRPEDKANLLLAACALSYVIRTFVISQWSANLFGDHVRTFEWTFKIVYIWFTAGIVMFLGFIYYCFPKQLPIKLYWGIVASQVPLYLIILALPVYTYYEMVKPLLDFSALALNATVLVILLRALIAREEGAGISLTGFLVSMASAINDLFWTMGLPYLFVPAIGYGFAFFFLCNTQIIAKRFALAFRKAELLSRNLQIEVDRQTREIKSILTYIEQGIFTIKGSEQSIGPDFSKHLAEIIETDDLTEHSISELLLEPANISSDQRSQIQSAIDAAIDEDSLTFEVNKNLLAREIVFRAKSGKEKILSIDWNPVLSKDDLVEKILVSVRDITSLRQLELQNKEREANMQLLIELIQIPEDRFQRFIKQTYEYLSDNIELIRATEEFRPEVIKRLFINMHTIKGAARTYLLKSLSASSHEIEQNYFNMQKTGEWNQKVLMEDIEQIKNILECYRELGEEKLGWQLSQRIVKIPVQIIEQIAENLVKLEAYQMEERQRLLLSKAKHTLYEHSFIPLSKVLEESFTGIESMARDLGKMHPEIKIDSATVIIKDSGVNLLHSLLVHLIRNSMDHGIETPEVRAGFGKEATGYIFVTSRVTNDFHLEIEYRDDGAGLDLPKIKLRAEEAGLLPAQSELSEQVIAELIFESGLTTKDQVSDVSGRGVGMDAVRRYTMDQGGSVEIRLLPPSKNSQNRPFKVVITMPDNCWFEAELLNLKQAS